MNIALEHKNTMDIFYIEHEEKKAKRGVSQ